VSEVVRVPHGDCVNAVGAVIAQVSGEVDQVFRIPRCSAERLDGGTEMIEAFTDCQRPIQRRAHLEGLATKPPTPQACFTLGYF
jgi:hypothetical protein